MSDRGMKKWLPYRSLIEHMPALEKMENAKKCLQKPVLMEDEIARINDILTNYQKQEICISFYRNRNILKREGIIKRIDIIEQKLLMEDDTIILFAEIVGLETK